MNKKEYHTSSPEETALAAKEIAQSLAPGAVLALHGDLGAGKTVFSRAFARALGITEHVSSPTFTIVQEYAYGNGNMLYHLDLYRIDNPESALAFGVDEFLYDKNAISLVEWPERIEGLFPPHTLHLYIERAGEDERILTFKDK